MDNELPSLSNIIQRPLRLDLCQRIYSDALRRAVSGSHPNALPEELPLPSLQQAAYNYGLNALILPDENMQEVFEGVDLLVYQLVENLYCSRLGRSIQTVWEVVNRLFENSGRQRIRYTAVWAICLYLENCRKEAVAVTSEQIETAWWIIPVSPGVRVKFHNDIVEQPLLVCTIDEKYKRVLGFQVVQPENIEDGVSLSLFDAITAHRWPDMDGAGGLVWQLPAAIFRDNHLPDVPLEFIKTVDVFYDSALCKLPLKQKLEGTWFRDLQDRMIPVDRFAILFDNYLNKIHGFGPRRNQKGLDRLYSELIGYNRDPALMFPALRSLLPFRIAMIDMDGKIDVDGLHYFDELLKFWSGVEVGLRRKSNFSTDAWVYLEGEEILCQANLLRGRKAPASSPI